MLTWLIHSAYHRREDTTRLDLTRLYSRRVKVFPLVDDNGFSHQLVKQICAKERARARKLIDQRQTATWKNMVSELQDVYLPLSHQSGERVLQFGSSAPEVRSPTFPAAGSCQEWSPPIGKCEPQRLSIPSFKIEIEMQKLE